MLRKGFTLAEVLIALLLVGILSSISIQTLRNRDNTAEYEAIRNKAMTNVQGVLHEALYAKSSSEIFGDESSGNYKQIMDFLNSRLSVGTATISGKDFGDGSISAKGQKMRDGSYYALTAKSGGALVAELTIDVNGDKAPNKEGTDIFKYNVDKFGGVLLSSISGSETEKSCKEKDPTKPFMWKNGSCHACPENIPNLMSDGSCQSCTQTYYHHGGCQSCLSNQWDNETNSCCKLVNGKCEEKEQPEKTCEEQGLYSWSTDSDCHDCPESEPYKHSGKCNRCPKGAEYNEEWDACGYRCKQGNVVKDDSECCPVDEYFYNNACNVCPQEKPHMVSGKCSKCPSNQEEVTITFRGKTTTQCLTKCAQGQIRNPQNGMCESECHVCTRAEMRSGRVMCCSDKLKCQDGSIIDITRVDAMCPEDMDNGQRYCCDCTRPWIRGNACLEGNSKTSDCEAHCNGGYTQTGGSGNGGGGGRPEMLESNSEIDSTVKDPDAVDLNTPSDYKGTMKGR